MDLLDTNRDSFYYLSRRYHVLASKALHPKTEVTGDIEAKKDFRGGIRNTILKFKG